MVDLLVEFVVILELDRRIVLSSCCSWILQLGLPQRQSFLWVSGVSFISWRYELVFSWYSSSNVSWTMLIMSLKEMSLGSIFTMLMLFWLLYFRTRLKRS